MMPSEYLAQHQLEVGRPPSWFVLSFLQREPGQTFSLCESMPELLSRGQSADSPVDGKHFSYG